MASWDADGTLSGYDPLTTSRKNGLLKFASAGSVDIEAITRVQYNIAKYGAARNALIGTAPFTFTEADMNAQPSNWKKLGFALYVARASVLPANPTPSDIYNLPHADLGGVLADTYWSSITGSASENFRMEADFDIFNTPDEKLWVLVIPARLKDPTSGIFSKDYIRYPQGIASINTLGRAISIFPNQTPHKPTITSPLPGSVHVAGSTFNLSYTTDDPDTLTPDDANRYNRDLAAVRFQYAAQPTQSNPDPTWRDLEWLNAGGFSFGRLAQYCRGDGGGDLHEPDKAFMIDDLSLSVVAGHDGGDEEGPPLHGLLPAGDWQLRVRVYDFGHPYPADANPLGVDLGSSKTLNLDTYPSVNASPWSESVPITVPTQVPAPIPLTPTSNIAVEDGKPVELSWQYRNTNDPPFDQEDYEVQIREVGDLDWTTVAYAVSSDDEVEVFPETPPATSAAQYLTDLGFEDGTVGEWTVSDPAFTSGLQSNAPSNVTEAVPGSHAGTHHLQVDSKTFAPGVLDWQLADFYAEIPASAFADDHFQFLFECWFRASDTATDLSVSIGWIDDSRAIISGEQYGANLAVTRPASGSWADEYPDGWVNFKDIPRYDGVVGPTLRPANAHALLLIVRAQASTSSAPAFTARMDDVSLIGSPVVSTDGFILGETNNYEWRVRVRDEDDPAVLSNFSEPARFWVVPAANSGEVNPLPADTIDGATLGCGTHRVFVYRRGGKERVGEIRNMSYIDWGRVRDDISTSKIEVSGWDVDCGNLLSLLESWAYEIVILRDNGYSVDRVWEGPITLLTYEVDSVTIHAKDVMGYVYRRNIRQQMNDRVLGASVVDRARRILQNAFAPDDPNVLAYLNPIETAEVPQQYRSTPAYSRTAFEEVDDMAANAGLDYTALGRSILLWGTRYRLGTLPEFRDEDLGAPPIVSEYGMQMANHYTVSDGNGVYGSADRLDENGVDPKYGLVEMLSSTWASESEADSGTYTQEGLETIRKSFEAFAERSIADRYPPPVIVRVPDNTTLNPDAVVSIQQLVPGVIIPLRSIGTLRKVVADQKLDSIKVVEQNGRETVSITLSPFSYDDTEAEGEE